MVSFDMKFMYFKISFVFVIILYIYFISIHQNDPEISSNDYSNLNPKKITKKGVVCDKICAHNCINLDKLKLIDIVGCFEQCDCPEEIIDYKHSLTRRFTFLEKVKHSIIFGFAIIIFVFLFRKFDTILKPSDNLGFNEYRRLSSNENDYPYLKMKL